MATAHQEKQMLSTLSQVLDTLIANAIRKIGGKNENDLCRYLPMNSGGYMHHFTLKKMKNEVPDQLSQLIKTFIIEKDRPVTVPPKQRAARGSRKKRDQIVLTKTDLEKMLLMARSLGDKEMIRKLMPKKDLKTIKRELISSIRHNKLESELWNTYSEVIQQTINSIT